jgi:hypothetical protein
LSAVPAASLPSEWGRSDRKEGVMSSKRQQTMAKLTRERTVKERRALKQEKKRAARMAKAAEGEGTPSVDAVDAVDAEDAVEAPSAEV